MNYLAAEIATAVLVLVVAWYATLHFGSREYVATVLLGAIVFMILGTVWLCAYAIVSLSL